MGGIFSRPADNYGVPDPPTTQRTPRSPKVPRRTEPVVQNLSDNPNTDSDIQGDSEFLWVM